MAAARLFCWIAAAVDALAVVALLSPPLSARLLGVAEAPVTPELRYAMRTSAALMLGWTCLLLWASARPVERRGVIALTVVPVIAGLAATEVLGVREGFVPLAGVLPLLVVQTLLAAFGAWSWSRAGRSA